MNEKNQGGRVHSGSPGQERLEANWRGIHPAGDLTRLLLLMMMVIVRGVTPRNYVGYKSVDPVKLATLRGTKK